MPNDYILLAIISVILIGGGLLLLSQAKSYRSRRNQNKDHRNSIKHASN